MFELRDRPSLPSRTAWRTSRRGGTPAAAPSAQSRARAGRHTLRRRSPCRPCRARRRSEKARPSCQEGALWKASSDISMSGSLERAVVSRQAGHSPAGEAPGMSSAPHLRQAEAVNSCRGHAACPRGRTSLSLALPPARADSRSEPEADFAGHRPSDHVAKHMLLHRFVQQVRSADGDRHRAGRSSARRIRRRPAYTPRSGPDTPGGRPARTRRRRSCRRGCRSTARARHSRPALNRCVGGRFSSEMSNPRRLRIGLPRVVRERGRRGRHAYVGRQLQAAVADAVEIQVREPRRQPASLGDRAGPARPAGAASPAADALLV